MPAASARRARQWGYAVPVAPPQEPERAHDLPASGVVRDSHAITDAVLAARLRPMSERLELALSWNAVAAELRVGLAAHTNTNR
jgi:hypothetical protein